MKVSEKVGCWSESENTAVADAIEQNIITVDKPVLAVTRRRSSAMFKCVGCFVKHKMAATMGRVTKTIWANANPSYQGPWLELAGFVVTAK